MTGVSMSSQFVFKPFALAVAIACATQAYAAPEGGEVVGGDGLISRSGATTSVVQNSDRLAIDWQSFDVGSDERVEFIQPGSDSVALNRVLSNDASEILGQITANGHVILVNPNGILFSESARVDVGGLVASGLRIDPQDFLNGDLVFTGKNSDSARVVNRGIIHAASGGNNVLIGRQVSNEGLIEADLGTVTLAAGRAAILSFDGNGMLGVRVTKETLQNKLGVDPAVSNSGEITAPLGRVLLTASVSQDVFSEAVNSDLFEGETRVEVHADGSFTLGKGAHVVNTGDIDVSRDESASLRSGAVVMLGSEVQHQGRISMWSEDPHNRAEVVLAASGSTTLRGDATIEEARPDEAFSAKVTLLGKQVNLLDNASIIASSVSHIRIGGPDAGKHTRLRATERVQIGENVQISSAHYSSEEGVRGGTIDVWSKRSTVVDGNLNVRGYTPGRDNVGDGGSITLASEGSLAYAGTADIARGNENSEPGHLILKAKNLTLGMEKGRGIVTQAALQASMDSGEVTLAGTKSVAMACDESMSLNIFNNFNVASISQSGTGGGRIELSDLALVTQYNDDRTWEITLGFEAQGDIAAPGIGSSEPPASISEYREMNVHLQSHSGSITHSASVQTFGGYYLARAPGDIRFSPGAQLRADENWVTGWVNVISGGNIDLPVSVGWGADYGNFNPMERDGVMFDGAQEFAVHGRDVNIVALRGLTRADIRAEDLVLEAHGDPGIFDTSLAFADVTGHTHLIGRAGAQLGIGGNFGSVSAQAYEGSSVGLSSNRDLIVRDVTAVGQSGISLSANYTNGNLTQQAGTRIVAEDAGVSLTGDHVYLGGVGNSTLSVAGGMISTNFRSALVLDGHMETTAAGSDIRFLSLVGAAEVTVGEHASFSGDYGVESGIFGGGYADVFNLYASVPIVIAPGEGLDTINILRPDVTFNLQNYDPDGSVVVPYTP